MQICNYELNKSLKNFSFAKNFTFKSVLFVLNIVLSRYKKGYMNVFKYQCLKTNTIFLNRRMPLIIDIYVMINGI